MAEENLCLNCMTDAKNHNINRNGDTMLSRVVGLDVLRVALALLIYMFHSSMHFSCYYSILNPFVSVGAIAMTGFFLLFGYSLRLVYGKTCLMEKKEMRRFYVRRMLGVLPLYYALALIHVLFLGRETVGENLLLFPIELLGLQSTFCSLFGVSHNGGTWFISCLLLGYLIYPFLQTVVMRLSGKHKVLLMLVCVFIVLWASIVCKVFNTNWIYDNPFYRILEFLIGLIVADINITEDSRFMKILRSKLSMYVIPIFMVGTITLLRYYARISDYMLLNWIALPCFILILFPLGSNRLLFLEKSRILGYASKISYAFFLAQFFTWRSGRWFVEVIGYSSNWIKILYTFTLCVIISIVMYEVVQVRFVGWIRRKYEL